MSSHAMLAARYAARHPEAAARSLHGLDGGEVARFLETLASDEADALVAAMAPDDAGNVLSRLSDDRRASMLERLPPDAATAILRRVPPEQRDALLGLLSGPRRRRLTRAVRFGPDTAGGIVDPSPPTATDDTTADAGVKRLNRRGADLPDLYVIDRQSRFLGAVSRQDLSRASPQTRLAQLVRANAPRLRATTPVPEVVAHPAWQDLDALPVVDGLGALVGVLRHRAVRRHLGGGAAVRASRSTGTDAVALGAAYCDLLARAMVALTTAQARGLQPRPGGAA